MELVILSLLSLGLMTLSMAGMALGALRGRRTLESGCAVLRGIEGAACDACPKPLDCPGRDAQGA